MLELANPRLASILRQRRFAEQLMAQGVDASPIQHPLQGLSRLAQSLLGGYEARSADTKMDEISAAQEKETGDFMRMMQPQQAAQPPMSGMPAAVAGQPIAPPSNAYASILQAESGGRMTPGIYGDGGRAAGPGQVHAAALADVNRAQGTNIDHATLASNPQVGAQVGESYYNQLLAKFDGDPAKAAAAYNAGPGRVAAAIQANPQNWQAHIPEATRGYVAAHLQRIGAGGGGAPPATGAPVVVGATSTAAPGADTEAQLGEASRLRALARQGLTSQNPRVRALAGSLGSEADAIERRAFEMFKRTEGTPPRSPERFTQDLAVAGAGRPTVEQRVYGEGAGTGMKIAAEKFGALQDRVIANKGASADLEMFDTAMKGFEPGAGADIRTAAERAKAFLGFDNAADQAGLMQNVQARLRLRMAEALKGQGPISDRERELLANAADLMGNDPRGARLIMRAIKGMHAYDDQVHEIYLKSAENNGGTPSPVEVGREIKKLGSPVDRSIIADLEKRAESKGKVGPSAAPKPPSSYQEGQTATGPGGAKMIYRGGQWGPLQ